MDSAQHILSLSSSLGAEDDFDSSDDEREDVETVQEEAKQQDRSQAPPPIKSTFWPVNSRVASRPSYEDM